MRPDLAVTDFSPADGEPGRPLLVLGPSLGTSVSALWGECAALLSQWHVVGWDLPGHGASPAARDPFEVSDLADAVLALTDRVLAADSRPGGAFTYAGDSVGGAVGLRLALDHPDRLDAVAVLCSGARIGTPDGWRERAATVRAAGTSAMVEPSATRWFAPGFAARRPDAVAALLACLGDADDDSYARVCEALAGFDVVDRLDGIDVPLLAIAGSEDPVTPPDLARQVSARVRRGLVEVLDGVGHLAPAETPARVAQLLDTLRRNSSDPAIRAGAAVRRQVLGDAHVEASLAAANPISQPFQELITRYAWGGIWTRPGLDRRSRSIVTLTALVAGGHHEELALHLRAARTNGLTDAEITEVLLQTAIYCGVPAANTAFRIAQQVLSAAEERTGWAEAP